MPLNHYKYPGGGGRLCEWEKYPRRVGGVLDGWEVLPPAGRIVERLAFRITLLMDLNGILIIKYHSNLSL